MWTGKLLGRSAGFTIKNAWPLLAALAIFAPVDYALNHFHHFLFENLKVFSGELFFAPPLSVLLINLVYALYQALLYALIWSRLHATPLTYKAFRDWLALSFWNFYLYFLIYYLIMVVGAGLLMIPVLIFYLVFPYLDLAILFDQKPLGAAIRKNLALIALMPVPVITLSLIRFVLAGFIPLILFAAGNSDAYQDAYTFLLPLLSLPVDVSVVVLYSYLTRHKIPRFYGGLDFDDAAPHGDWF
ncbi:MAG TPA: hypothetical protein VM658_19165 [bacterium]|nr:hypothetical protein [bacterium]